MFENMNQNPFMMPENQSFIDIDNNEGNVNIDLNQTQSLVNGPMMGEMQTPVIEPVRERIVNRTIEHVVPHVCPIRTRVINHHVFKHTYSPNYTCCEENIVQHVQCGSCCNY